MKYGIFSDVHGNLEAFQAVLNALKKEQVDGYVFVGDIVGYGADPKRCIQILKELIKNPGCTCVAGNHDYAVCGLTNTHNYNIHAQQSIDWTKSQLDESEMDFLREMELVQTVNGITVVHANLLEPKEWGYIFDIDDAYSSFQRLESQVCFIGHSHKPMVFTSGEIVDWSIEDSITIKKGVKYIINIGSVGQPRDGNPKASFAIYDIPANRVEIRRVDYIIEQAQRKIIDAGLPKVLADRLSLGK